MALTIQKAKETMTAKKRVQKTFAMEKTDRVTIGYDTNAAVHMRFAKALGIEDGDMEKTFQALGVDYRMLIPAYTGKPLFEQKPDRMVDPMYGFYMRYVANDFGGYLDFCDFPLKDADDEVIANYPVPNPDDFDYDAVCAYAGAMADYGLYIGNAGWADIMNSTGRVMGMEQTYMNIYTQDEATLTYIDRVTDMEIAVSERLLERLKGKIDFMWIGEDLGTQHAPIISLDTYRAVLRPRHQRYVDLAKAYNIPVICHTCGSSSWVYEDFIEMGIRAVDTLQPEAANMSPKYLKEHFGGRLGFRGCISTAGPLAYGTAADTTKVCRETLDIMMPGYGYHFAPTHAIQDNTPVENIFAMYQAAHDFGVYR